MPSIVAIPLSIVYRGYGEAKAAVVISANKQASTLSGDVCFRIDRSSSKRPRIEDDLRLNDLPTVSGDAICGYDINRFGSCRTECGKLGCRCWISWISVAIIDNVAGRCSGMCPGPAVAIIIVRR